MIAITKEEFGKITTDLWRRTVRHAVDEEIRLFDREREIEALEVDVLPDNGSSDEEDDVCDIEDTD